MGDELQTLVYIAASGLLLVLGAKGVQYLTKPKNFTGRRIACFGDSITANGGYCNEIARTTGAKVKSFGYVGQGTDYILKRMHKVMQWQPTDVVILAGVNDLPSKSSTHTATNLAKMYATFRNAGIRVVAVPITPWHGYASAKGNEAKTEDVNRWITFDARVDEVVSIAALGDNNWRLLPQYDSGDGLHLNAKGQQVLGGLIAVQSF